MTHSPVKIFNKDSHQKSSLQNYLTFATAEKYAKKDNYSTFVNQCVKIINSSLIYLNGRENQLYVHYIIGNLIIKI
uniref:Uncharacterized protein n=1 Tax=Strongyloides venezuelensis TaxID=75913 RepID=A0A0K0FJR3_STRVS